MTSLGKAPAPHSASAASITNSGRGAAASAATPASVPSPAARGSVWHCSGLRSPQRNGKNCRARPAQVLRDVATGSGDHASEQVCEVKPGNQVAGHHLNDSDCLEP